MTRTLTTALARSRPLDSVERAQQLRRVQRGGAAVESKGRGNLIQLELGKEMATASGRLRGWRGL
ncbi:hypothetical protein OsJ_33170 [Oryza sativa Japonica Group]|uniref:Uncharacterized protein n=1 Tax=Oryza sativa subsp. japonica TaxID=39947 RepID=A3C972_ORYSJ|nr:hypothetical protein OsJ_33170 [Oryza sativa Japonica Group]